ncbi:MAG: hypothetical protein AAGC54_13470, partial [Cyanobacteria bacterium P01_F01_bin.4]
MVTGPDIEVVDSVAQLSEVPLAMSIDGLVVVAAELNDGLLQSLLALMEAAGGLTALLLVDEDVDRRRLSQVLLLGVVGVVPSLISGEGLRSAIATLNHGLTVIHPDFTEAVFDSTLTLFDDGADLIAPLTRREIEVLGQLARGLSNK